MAQLNYTVLQQSGYPGYILRSAPEKVMQFGEGNFLRAFVDDFFDIANEKAGFNGKVVLVQPIAQGLTDLINAQEGLYTLYLRGSQNGQKVDDKRVISSVSRCLSKKAASRLRRQFRCLSEDLSAVRRRRHYPYSRISLLLQHLQCYLAASAQHRCPYGAEKHKIQQIRIIGYHERIFPGTGKLYPHSLTQCFAAFCHKSFKVGFKIK